MLQKSWETDLSWAGILGRVDRFPVCSVEVATRLEGREIGFRYWPAFMPCIITSVGRIKRACGTNYQFAQKVQTAERVTGDFARNRRTVACCFA